MPGRSTIAGSIHPTVETSGLIAMRTGYVLFGLFLVLIIAGFVTGFPSGLAQAATICLVAGTLLLAPAMTFTYAVKAAEREDEEGDWR